ncbi:hypothetical protein Ae168Ps1_0161c [Pseudonocardia sp. Ae168_Ps1]|nr:hypothetical protein Ae150APs1_0165c [Pseudonocardia sp. Ae150A_Ps1]OLL77755.1 hypothetical protein Ae168Ps1_0161c [Pseudonocardia sp. Ae168_Ps1]OLL88122.1 hypothetical protein Ae263Ps1_5177 [Pseudonocardia sp. Ae263_Ps1]OLL91852.1 hypothetical protein Ae356Ps1_1749c [Pseudonocardia sp. Ae356_Ps1]
MHTASIRRVDQEVVSMFRAAPSPDRTAGRVALRPVLLAGLLMVLLAAATIVSVTTAPAPVTLLLAAAALSVRPLVVLHHRRAAGRPALIRR